MKGHIRERSPGLHPCRRYPAAIIANALLHGLGDEVVNHLVLRVLHNQAVEQDRTKDEGEPK
jgi:hypothetical protein